MGMLNSDILSVSEYQTKIEHISSDTIFVSASELDKKEQDSDSTMRSTSRGSSTTSSTELVEDVGDGEEENGNDGGNIKNRGIPAAEEILVPSDAARSCTDKEFGWSTITIREYARVLGDNITVMGPPIGLSWEHQDEIVYDLKEYDTACQDSRRSQSELKMPSKHRDQILIDGGYSRQEIQEAIKRSNIARNQRKRTIETLNLQPLQETLEKIIRGGKNKFRKKKSVEKVNKRSTI